MLIMETATNELLASEKAFDEIAEAIGRKNAKWDELVALEKRFPIFRVFFLTCI